MNYFTATMYLFFSPIFRAIHFLAWLVIFWPLDWLMAHTHVGSFVRRHSHEDDALAHLERETVRMKKTRDDLLVHDRRTEYAERLVPKDKHPTWWTVVPKHLRRSLVSHGRIRETGYAPAPLLAGGTLTGPFVERAWGAAVRASLQAGVMVFLCMLVAAWFFGRLGSVVPALGNEAQGEPSQSVVSQIDAPSVARDYRDVFAQSDVDEVNQKLAAAGAVTVSHGPLWAAKTTAIVAWPLRAALLLLAALLAALAGGRLMFIARLRWLVRDAVDRQVAHLRLPFRQALQSWKFFLADRRTNDRGFADQVEFATRIDRSPLLYFGEGEGQAEAGGHLLAPRAGHEFCHSIVDALQHHEVLGGSGESKSRDFYVPLLAQLMRYRKDGYPIATLVTDEKGAIVEDVRRIAEKLGLQDDLLIIGTGPNDYRVDLMEAGSPLLVAEFIKSAARQAGTTGGSDFWSEMGNDLMLNIWIVTQAAERTIAGENWSLKAKARLHSVKSALRLATSDAELQDVIDMVIEARRSKNEFDRIADLCNDGLRSAIRYLLLVWLPMIDATRDGIRANLRNALRALTMKPEIAAGFADGVSDRLIPASEMHSNKIKVLNVSQIEHGLAGRMVAIVLKTIFFKQCRDVQQQDPAFADRRLAWWFDPKLDDPRKDDYYLEFFLADEYQSLITSDSSSGFSDATVWNVLRSAGVAGVTISQGIGAYEYAIGRDATANIRRQWRSKTFLRTEDTSTIDEARKLVGKTIRYQVSDWAHYESTAAVRNELGTDPDNLRDAQWDPAYDQLGFFGHGALREMNFGTWDSAFALDERFIINQPNDPNFGLAGISSKQAAYWRHEDRSSSAMQHGLLDADVLRDEQIMAMTRGRALTLLQVAGGTQVDIIRLNARAYRRYTDDATVSAEAWQ